jgi:MATE family multidrug resistance protein
LPVGALLAFATTLSGVGLWIGLACGLACVAVLLLARWRSRERAGFFHPNPAHEFARRGGGL